MSQYPATIFVTALVLVITGCTSTTTSEPAGSSTNQNSLQHVHALQVTESDHRLYIATHQGLYILPADVNQISTATGPIGNDSFDPMGFTIDGRTGTAYASGHPGTGTPASLGSPNLGLIQSTDNGTSWSTVSLKNETDFHALAVDSTTDGPVWVYGLRSSDSTIQRSNDAGATWSTGPSIVARSLISDPNQPNVLYATTADGVAVSRDNASSFQIDADAPRLYLMATDTITGDIAGVDALGNIWKRDTQRIWSKTGTADKTLVALAVSAGRIYAADENEIVRSDNYGLDWQSLMLLTE